MLNTLPARIPRNKEVTWLTASGSRYDRRFETGLIGQLLRSSDMPAAALERCLCLLETVSQDDWHRALRYGRSADIRAIFEELGELFLSMTKNGPLLITIDDIQYSDRSSIHFLLHLIRRAANAPVLIVISEPIELPLPDPWLRTELLRLPCCQQIRLGPLSRDGVTRLLAQHQPLVLARELTPEFYAITGGNPLLVQALIKDSGTALAEGRVLPQHAFSHAVQASLHRYDPRVIRVAQVLSVLDEAADGEVVSEMLRRTPESANRIIDILRAARLVVGFRLRHKAIRTAVLDGLPPGEQADMHKAAATALHNHYRPARQVAEHLVAVPGWIPAWALQVLCEAAEDALEDGAAEAAVTYLRRAHQDCSGDEVQRAAVLARLCRALWRFDPSAAARRTPELLDAFSAGYLDGPGRMTLIKQLLWEGRAEAAAGIVGTCPAGLEVSAGPDTAALFLVALYPSLADTSLARDRPHTNLAHTFQALRDGGLTEQTLGPVLSSLIALVETNQAEEAETWIGLLLGQSAGRTTSPTWEALLLALQAVARVKRGYYTGAVTSARTAAKTIGPKGWGALIGLPLASLIIATTQLGRTAEAAGLLYHRVPSAMMKGTVGLLYLHARGQYHLAVANVGAALRDFDACNALSAEWGPDARPLLRWQLDWARALLRIGDIQRARQLLTEELLDVPPGDSLTRGTILHLLALTRPFSEQPPLLRHALRLLNGAPTAQAHAYTDLSHALRRLGDQRGAAAAAQRAGSLFSASGTKPCEPNLAHRQPAAAGFGALEARLSNAEQRVARLAAKGFTNGQIACQLHITISTVEQHLTHIYRKLKIQGRVDLQSDRRFALVSRRRRAGDQEPAHGLMCTRLWSPSTRRLARRGSGAGVTCTALPMRHASSRRAPWMYASAMTMEYSISLCSIMQSPAIEVYGPMYEPMTLLPGPTIAGPTMRDLSTLAPGSTTTRPTISLAASTVPDSRGSMLSRTVRLASSRSLTFPVSFQ
jgi:DNA-binding CsgD family transcriptional regulator